MCGNGKSDVWWDVCLTTGFGFMVDEHGNMLKKPQVSDAFMYLN